MVLGLGLEFVKVHKGSGFLVVLGFGSGLLKFISVQGF